MRNTILLLLTLCLAQVGFSQATLFEATFESSNPFTFSGDLLPNEWRAATCAGNGTTIPGSTALYISQGGADAGCGPTGTDQYTFANASSGTLMTIASTTVDATCASSLNFSFDYQIESNIIEDFAELVYSTDGGTSWTAIGSPLPVTSGWTLNTISLPGLLDFQTFEIGFRFTYDAANNTGIPLAVDNLKLTGTDTVDPIMVCQSSDTIIVNQNCEPIAKDFGKTVFSISDNCTDSVDITFSQNYAIGSILPGAPGDLILLELTAYDETGNSTMCSFNVVIIDNTPPTLVCPADSNLYVDNNCEVSLGDFSGAITISDNCSSSANLIITQTPTPGTTLSGNGTITLITIDLEDESGNTTQCTFNTTLVDTILPTLTCPGDQTAYANAACQTSLLDYTGSAVFADNCVPQGSLTLTQSPAPGTSVADGQTITFTLTGGIPSTPQTCTFNLSVIDTIKPNISCPTIPTAYVDNNCEYLLGNYTGSILWSDNCETSLAAMTVIQSPSAGSVVSTNTAITITMTDPSGNSKSCNTSITVLDTISPSISCPTDFDIPMNSSCFATHTNYSALATVNDNCSTVFSQSQSPIVGTTFNVPTTVTLTASDESGNQAQCQFVVTPIDTTKPTITCPTDYQVDMNNGCGFDLTNQSGLATASDNCTSVSNLTFMQTPVIGSTLAAGSNSITLVVLDESGNSESCAFNLTVVDMTNPTITFCPSGVSEYADVNCSSTLTDYTNQVMVNDNCTSLANLTFQQTPVSGTSFSSNQSVSIVITDEAGNFSTCTFTANLIDTIKPTITCPADMDMAINGSCQYTVPDLTGNVTGADNCTSFANLTVTQNPIGGSTGTGTTAVLLSLTDAQGNSSVCVTTLNPIDNIAPQITCPTPGPVNNGFNCDYILPFYGSSAPVIDNCSNYQIAQMPSQGTIVQPGTTEITLTVTDAGGNTATCSFPLTVIEYEAPVISCPQNTTTCNPIVNYLSPTFTDNCFAFMSQTDNTGLTNGDTFPVGITVLEYTVADSSGNTASCSFLVEVLDYPSPANILEDTISVCGQNSIVIEAEQNVTGTGEWTFVSGQGDFNNEFAFQTGVNNLSQGTSMVVWTVSSASCGSTSDTLIINNSDAPSPASVQDTIIACGLDQINLLAATPLIGTGMWSTPNGADINNPLNSVTTATNLANGWNEFVWTVSSPGCPSNSDTLQVLASANVQIYNSDTTFCWEDQTALSLTGSAISGNQTALWSFVDGTGFISDPFSNTTDLTSLGLGVNRIIYTVTHPLCPNDKDTITIITTLCNEFAPVFPTVITPNFDGKNDVFEILNLQELYPSCEMKIFNRWGSLVHESIGYSEPWDGKFHGEDLPMGTYFFKLSLNDEEGTVYTGPISIIH